MRMAVALLAAAAVAGLGFTADAAPSKKKARTTASKERPQTDARRDRAGDFGYNASPEHYRTGSSDWWRAMDKEGRGGFGDTP